jgi:hypothetical protein
MCESRPYAITKDQFQLSGKNVEMKYKAVAGVGCKVGVGLKWAARAGTHGLLHHLTHHFDRTLKSKRLRGRYSVPARSDRSGKQN